MAAGIPPISFPEAFQILESTYESIKPQDEEPEETFTAILNILSTSHLSGGLGSDIEATLGSIVPRASISELARKATTDPGFADGFARLVESFWVQAHIKAILVNASYGDDVFEGYLETLKLDSAEVQHEEVLKNIWKWFDEKTDSETVRKLRIVFIEEEVAQNLGMDDDTMVTARGFIADDDLYRDVLTYLNMHHSSNLHWHQVVEMTRSIVLRRKPTVWEPLESLLNDWRAGVAEQFLIQARDLIDDDEIFNAFSQNYLADEDEAMNQMTDLTDDVGLVDQLKKLQIAAATESAGGVAAASPKRRAVA